MARKVKLIKPTNIGMDDIRNEFSLKKETEKIREYLYKLTEQIEKAVNSVLYDTDENARTISDLQETSYEALEKIEALEQRISKLEE